MEFKNEELDLLIDLLDKVQFTRKDIPVIEPLYQKLIAQKVLVSQVEVKEE